MKATLSRTLLTLGLVFALGSAASAAEALTCEVCNMKVDAKRNVQFRYVLESGKKVLIGSLTCAKSYWSEHKEAKLVFEATDFVSGEWSKADDGHFLVGSKLKFGTGMDRASVLFFADRKMAEKAKAANGGKIMKMHEAVKHAAGGGHHAH